MSRATEKLLEKSAQEKSTIRPSLTPREVELEAAVVSWRDKAQSAEDKASQAQARMEQLVQEHRALKAANEAMRKSALSDSALAAECRELFGKALLAVGAQADSVASTVKTSRELVDAYRSFVRESEQQ